MEWGRKSKKGLSYHWNLIGCNYGEILCAFLRQTKSTFYQLTCLKSYLTVYQSLMFEWFEECRLFPPPISNIALFKNVNL